MPNRMYTDADVLRVMATRTTQDRWASISSRRVERLVIENYFKHQRALTLLFKFKFCVHDAEDLVLSSSTAQFGHFRERNFDAYFNPQDILVLNSPSRSNVNKLVRYFSSLTELNLVINCESESFLHDQVVELLTAWAPRLTALSIWMSVHSTIDSTGQRLSRLDPIWPVFSEMLVLRRLSIEVRQSNLQENEFEEHTRQAPFEVTLGTLSQLELFAFGSKDGSTSAWPSVVVLQRNERLREIFLSTSVTIPMIGTGAMLLDPMTGKIKQLNLIVTQERDVLTLRHFENLQSLTVAVKHCPLVWLLEQVASYENLATVRQLSVEQQGGPITLMETFFLECSMPHVKSLSLGYFSSLAPPINLRPLVRAFPDLQELALCVHQTRPAWNDRTPRPRYTEASLVELIGRSGICSCTNLQSVVLLFASRRRMNFSIDQLRQFHPVEEQEDAL